MLLGVPFLANPVIAAEQLQKPRTSQNSYLYQNSSQLQSRSSVQGEFTPAWQLAEQKKSKPAVKQQKKTSKKRARKPHRSAVLKKPEVRLLQTLLTAEMAVQRNMIPVAVRNYLKAAQLSRDPSVAERAAKIAVYARDDKRALKAAKLWVELSPLNTEARQVLATLLVRNNQTDSALEHLETVIADGLGDEQKSYMLITSLLSKERDKHAAMGVMEKLIAKRPKNTNALYAYAHLAMLVSDYNKAEKALFKLLSIKNNSVEPYFLLAKVLERQSKDKEALELLKGAVDNLPDKHELRLFYARKLVDEKLHDDAREQFRVLSEHDNKSISGDAVYALGLLALEFNDKSDAKDYFKKLIELGVRVSEANYHLGQIEERGGNPDKAIEYYNEVVYGDFDIEARIRIAVITARMGKVKEAREQLKSIDAKTVDVELRLYLAEGEMLNDSKQSNEAFNLYTEALAELPDNAELLYARSLVAVKLERIDVAIQDLKTLVERHPGNSQFLNALGYTLIDSTDKIDAGVRYIEQAYQLNSNDPAIIDSMGWAYYRQGRHDDALRFLRKAFELNKDPEIAAHLGEVMWVSGDHEGAREVWDEALRETPSHKILLDVIKRFTE